MQQLYREWTDAMPASLDESQLAEPPLPGLFEAKEIHRFHSLTHPTHGMRGNVPTRDVESLQAEGWKLLLEPEDLLELVHLQAWYFQVRFFPRLRWIILDAPENLYFVLGDRPVIWGANGRFDLPPRSLRQQAAELIAPLSKSVALFACNPHGQIPSKILPAQINKAVTRSAADWIVGSDFATVEQALRDRDAVTWH